MPLSSKALHLVTLLVAAVAVALVLLVSPSIAVRPIDYAHYVEASTLILQGISPYQQVEFFAPPWFAFFMYPFLQLPTTLAPIVWLAVTVFAVCGTALVSSTWIGFPSSTKGRYMATMATAILPPALYVYVTGQLSALVTFTLVYLAAKVPAPPRFASRLVPMLGFAVLTLKPHIVLLPALLLFLQLVRERDWKSVAYVASAMACLGALASIVLPGWPQPFLQALTSGQYRGGPGLVATGYLGLRELGVPGWLLIPIVAYAMFYWWKHGPTPLAVSFAIVANLIVVPYSRAYDYVILILPALVAVHPTSRPLIFPTAVLAVVAISVAPITPLALVTPTLMAIALLVRVLRSSGTPGPKPRLVRASTESEI